MKHLTACLFAALVACSLFGEPLKVDEESLTLPGLIDYKIPTNTFDFTVPGQPHFDLDDAQFFLQTNGFCWSEGLTALTNCNDEICLMTTIQTNIVTNATPVSITYDICNHKTEIKGTSLTTSCLVYHQPRTNYSYHLTTNRTASFSFEGKTYSIELKP